MAHLLIVEDDGMMSQNLAEFLTTEGFEVTVAATAKSALACCDPTIDLALIDWTLPDGDGIELVKKWRMENPRLAMIMVTAKASTLDKVVALELGSTDYVTKPFDPLELVARIRCQLRQAKRLQNPDGDHLDQLTLAGIVLDQIRQKVTYQGAEITLTRKQFALLRLLLLNPGQVFTRDELLNKVWGYDSYPSTRTVDNHIAQLRQKFSPDLFETVHGIGYRLHCADMKIGTLK